MSVTVPLRGLRNGRQRRESLGRPDAGGTGSRSSENGLEPRGVPEVVLTRLETIPPSDLSGLGREFDDEFVNTDGGSPD